MRAKRSKKYRKLMHQYALTFGFREPYQILVDSHFLQAIYAFKMDFIPALERTLQGKVKPLISKCSLAALNASSSSSSSHKRPPSLPPPTTLPLRHCSHNPDSMPIDEVSCLLELLGGKSSDSSQKKNKEHYILASADPTPSDGAMLASSGKGPEIDVRTLARDIPGVPIIYVKRSVMVLEEMSDRSTRAKSGLETAKYKSGFSGDIIRKRKRDDESVETAEAGGEPQPLRTERKWRAKGPNPLSVKKPKKKARVTNQTNFQTGEAKGVVKAKRKRRHKRTTPEIR